MKEPSQKRKEMLEKKTIKTFAQISNKGLITNLAPIYTKCALTGYYMSKKPEFTVQNDDDIIVIVMLMLLLIMMRIDCNDFNGVDDDNDH